MTWFIVLWLFVIGACVGSFLNVVVYRVPAGKSLWYPPSQCPACGHAIRARHNVPVLGWLLLKGCCYDCGAGISPRYPLVELLTGTVFFAIAVPEFVLGGSNLFNPLGQDWPTWLRATAYAMHVVLMCVLLVAGQIAWNAQRVPLAMPAAVLVLTGAALAALPQLRPILFASGMRTEPPAAALALRVAVGSFAGLLTRPALARGAAGWREAVEMSACLAMVAVVLGWQAVTQITALSAVVYLLSHRLGRRVAWIASSPRLAYAGLATFLSILFWKPLLAWLSRQERCWEVTICGGLLALALACSWLARWTRSSVDSQTSPRKGPSRAERRRAQRQRRGKQIRK